MHIVFKCKNLICACTLGSFLILFTTPLCAHPYLFFLAFWVGINDIEGIRMPFLCILYSNANYNYAQTLGSFLISFRALSFWSYHNILFCPNWFFGSFDCLLHLLNISLQFLILNIVWLPPNFVFVWISAYVSTLFMRNAHFGEEFSLCWPFKIFIHFGTWCQWGRSLEGLREMVLLLSLVWA